MPTDDDIRFDIDVNDRSRVADRRPSAAEASLRRPRPPPSAPSTARSTCSRRRRRRRQDLHRYRLGHRHDAPTAHRMIRALEDHGLLMQVGGHGYCAGTASPPPRRTCACGTFHCAISRTLPSNDSRGPPGRALSSTFVIGTRGCVSIPWSPRTSSAPSSRSGRRFPSRTALAARSSWRGVGRWRAWQRLDGPPSRRRPGTRLARMVATTKRRGLGRFGRRAGGGRRFGQRPGLRCARDLGRGRVGLGALEPDRPAPRTALRACGHDRCARGRGRHRRDTHLTHFP